MTAAHPLPPLDDDDLIGALSPEDIAAMDRVDAASAPYGQDFARELADLRAGRHPLQSPRG